MAVTYAIYASIAAAGLVLGLAMGLVLGWLWHRATISRLRGQRDMAIKAMLDELRRVRR